MSPVRIPQAAPDATLADLREAIRRARLWMLLAWNELAGHYKRTKLGVVWIPVNLLIQVSVLGLIFSALFSDDERFIPHFAVGLAVWTMIARAISDAAVLWDSASKYLLHMRVPLSVFLLKVLWKCTLVLAITVPVGIAVALVTGARPTLGALLAVPGAAVLLLNVFWASTLFSIVCLKYRDLAKFTPSAITLLYLATPILWQPERLGDKRWIADLNPLFHAIELVRAPLLGQGFPAVSWVVATIGCLVGTAAAFALFAATRRRIVLWM